jgi:hypothetical protein
VEIQRLVAREYVYGEEEFLVVTWSRALLERRKKARLTDVVVKIMFIDALCYLYGYE